MSEGTFIQPALGETIGPTCPYCGEEIIADRTGKRMEQRRTCGKPECKKAHRATYRAPKVGRQIAEYVQARTFKVKCVGCGVEFEARSGAAKRCDECRRCRQCGTVMQRTNGTRKQFCDTSCAALWKAAHYGTRLEAARQRGFTKICILCEKQFAAHSGRRTRCPECCKCRQCGAKLRHADTSRRFCGGSCASAWQFENNEAIAATLAAGRAHPNRGLGISRARKGVARPELRGEKNHNWKGGTYRKERQTAMGRIEYKVWRQTVFKRDYFRCVLCGASGVKLEANHIRLWRDYPELRYDVDNGVTLCGPCHKSIRGIEGEFEERFLAYVLAARKATLTEEEAERLQPLITSCGQCGTELHRPRSHRKKKFHFCDAECRRAFERSGGYSRAPAT
jgi:hypothetical protein